MAKHSTQTLETLGTFMIGGAGFSVHEYDPVTSGEQSVFDDVKVEIGKKLDIDPDFVKFLDQYQLDKLEKIGEVAHPLVREAIAIQIVNFLGLPDLMGKKEYLDLRDGTTAALLKAEIRNSKRDENHAINLFDQRFPLFFNHISMVLPFEDMQRFCDEIEVYYEDLGVRRRAISKTLGVVGVGSANIARQ